MVYLEQPEIHLHPRAQAIMADILVEAINRGVRVVVETHSSILLLSLQALMAEGKITHDKVKLHWFERNKDGATTVTSADLDEAGSFGDWPEDFGDVSLQVESRYLDAAEVKRKVSKMPADSPINLVIDASIARASGNEGAVYPTSKKCRDLLINVLEFRHGVVITPEIGAEWRRHQSSFTRKWRVRMEARKKVYRINVPQDIALREKMLRHTVSAKKKEAVKKDFHLIEAALRTN